MRLVSLGVFLFLFLSPFCYGEPSSTKNELDTWLRQMGFKDYSAEIRGELKKQEKEVKKGLRKTVGLSPAAKANMEFQSDRFEMINAARDLTTWLYDNVQDRLGKSADLQGRVVELVARSLVLQPQELPDDWPNSVKTEAEKKDFIQRFTAKAILNITDRLTNEFIKAAYGTEKVGQIMQNSSSSEAAQLAKEINYVRDKVLTYTSRMQMDSQLGQSGFLGDALSLAFVRNSRMRDGKGGVFERELKNRALQVGAHLENSISNSHTFANQDGKDKSMTFNNGSFVFEYSQGDGAAEIAFGGRPGLRGTLKAWIRGTLGHAINYLVHNLAEKANPRTYLGRLTLWASNLPLFNSGISHVGQGFVDSDHALDLHHVTIRDMYPDAQWGGARITTPRSFALNGPFRRIIVADQDTEKLAQEFLRQTDPNEKKLANWESDEAKLYGKDLKPKKSKTLWPKLYSEEDIPNWRKLARENPEAFKNLYLARTVHGWDFLRNNGTVFDYGFTNLCGGSYCSKGVVLPPILEMGFDIEPERSRWAFPLEWITKLVKGGLEPIRQGGRFVAPVSVSVQNTIGRHEIINFPSMTDLSRRLAKTEPFIPETDLKLKEHLESIPWKLSGNGGAFLDSLVETVKENVEGRVSAESKTGPSAHFDNKGYASLALQKPKKQKAPKNAPMHYPKTIGKSTIASHTASKSREEEISNFLNKMGFENYVTQMEKNLKEGSYPNQLNRIALEGNVQRYSMVDNARELACHLMARAVPNLKNPAFRERFIRYAADLLNIKPEIAVRAVPMNIRNIEDPAQRVEAIENYFEKATRNQGRLQLERLVSDYLNTFYGQDFLEEYLSPESENKKRKRASLEEYKRTRSTLEADITRVTNLFSDYLYSIHLDPHIGGTQWVGRGMALALARHSRLHHDPLLETSFKKELCRRGQHLENFISNNLKMRDAAGQVQTTPVNTGDFIFARGVTGESTLITSAAVPKDTKRAKKEKLIGNPLGMLIPIDEKAMNGGLRRMDRLRYALSVTQMGTPGFSHVGQIVLFKDPETGLISQLVFDNYPLEVKNQLAGVRISGVENFGNEEHYTSVGIASIDPEKFHEYATDYASQKVREGWDPIAWPAYKPKVDEHGAVIPDTNPERGDWRINISEKEFIQMHSEKDPKKWIEMWRKNVGQSWGDMLKKGVYFNWVDNGAGMTTVVGEDGKEKSVFTKGKYYEGGTYCSQGCHLASMTSTGIPMEAPNNEGGFSRFSRLLGFVNEHLFSIPQINAFDLNTRILPPSSLALQDWINERDQHPIQKVAYPVASLAERQRSVEGTPDVERNLAVTVMLRNNPAFQAVLKEKMTKQLDPDLRENSIHQAIIQTVTRTVSQGTDPKEILGIDLSEMDEIKQKDKNPSNTEESGGKLLCNQALVKAGGLLNRTE